VEKCTAVPSQAILPGGGQPFEFLWVKQEMVFKNTASEVGLLPIARKIL
jgi:hypothetical protein